LVILETLLAPFDFGNVKKSNLKNMAEKEDMIREIFAEPVSTLVVTRRKRKRKIKPLK